MTLRILDPNDGTQRYLSFADFFDLNNPGDYELYEDHNYTGAVDFLIQNAIAFYSNYDKYNFKKLLFLDIRHNSEDQIIHLNDTHAGRITVTNARDFNIDNPKILFNDYLFNRTKAYHLKYPFTSSTGPWYLKSWEDFVIPNVVSAESRNKIYIATNKTYFDAKWPRQRFYRKKLMSLLKSKYSTSGHLGDPADPSIGTLPSHSRMQFVGYSPPHSMYFENSFISIYAETLEYGSTFAVTEKTFDPLIKGHFILPFGTYKFIENTKLHYGFEFPDFIDYSYDLIEDGAQRYHAYSREVERLLAIPIDTWREHWDNYKVLRATNQQIFFNRPYHRIDLSQVDSL
jgi:hypothetical protein